MNVIYGIVHDPIQSYARVWEARSGKIIFQFKLGKNSSEKRKKHCLKRIVEYMDKRGLKGYQQNMELG